MVERIQEEMSWSCRNYLRGIDKKPRVPGRTGPAITVPEFLTLFQYEECVIPPPSHVLCHHPKVTMWKQRQGGRWSGKIKSDVTGRKDALEQGREDW